MEKLRYTQNIFGLTCLFALRDYLVEELIVIGGRMWKSRGRSHRIRKSDREIPARRILNMIRNGDPVRCDHKIILGNLDIGKLDLPVEDGKTLITSIIEIKDSQIYGDINFANALFKNDFKTSVDFTKTIFHGRVNFHCTLFCDGADFRS
jgi:hypothetical protein